MSGRPASTRLDAIVLAAGAGRRFGGRKLLASFEGRSILAHVLEAAFASPAVAIHVVTGCDAEAVSAAATGHAEKRGRRIDVVRCPGWAEGMAASLRAGVRSLPPDVDGAFIFLGDIPRVPLGISKDLAAALDAGAPAAAPVHAGRRGHPVLLGRQALAGVAALRGDRGAAPLLADLGERVRCIATDDPGVLADIDTPEDLCHIVA